MPTCYACHESVPTGAAGGWLTLRRLPESEGPTQSLGLFCSAQCTAAALYALQPWDVST